MSELVFVALLAVILLWVVSIAPVWFLVDFGYARSALAVGVATSTGLVVDHFYNWDGIAYPSAVLALPQEFFQLTVIAIFWATAIGYRAWKRQIRQQGALHA